MEVDASVKQTYEAVMRYPRKRLQELGVSLFDLKVKHIGRYIEFGPCCCATLNALTFLLCNRFMNKTMLVFERADGKKLPYNRFMQVSCRSGPIACPM